MENTNGRDTNGRFAPGNHFGVTGGRPAHTNKLAYLEVTEGVVTPERWRKIVERAANEAETGTGRDAASARDFLAKYVLPLPQKLDITLSGSRYDIAGRGLEDLSIEELEAIRRNPERYLQAPDGTIIEMDSEGTASPA